MAAKLRQRDGFYWVVVHHRGRRKWKKIGRDKREALKVVHKVNAQLALGEFSLEPAQTTPTVAEALWAWYESYRPTFSPSFAQKAAMNIRRHLVPFFGHLRLSELHERHILEFVSEKTVRSAEPLAARTITTILSVLRRVLALAVEDGQISRNPARNMGRLLAKVRRQQADEVEHVRSWTRDEVAILLDVAHKHEARFYPLLLFLLSTGCRKGEALGLKWEDIDFTSGRVLIRRAFAMGHLGTPKSGRMRSVAQSPSLVASFRELLSRRRREALERGWEQVPEFVFCSEAGGAASTSAT